MIITYINIEDGPKVKTPIVVMSTCLDNLMLSTELIQTSVSSVFVRANRGIVGCMRVYMGKIELRY